MKNNRFLLILLLIICLLIFFLIMAGYTEKGFINYEQYKKIKNKIINYQITKNQLINKLGEPKYDLYVELLEYNFYSNVLVYETRRSDLSKLLIILRVREDDGNKIDPNITFLNDEKDMLWPGFGTTLEDIIHFGREKSEKKVKINSLIKSCEEIITYINTYSGDYTREVQGKLLNDRYLSNVKSYKNVKKGYLIIVFNWESSQPINACFIVRLFDRNGNYLSHFLTKEVFRLFPLKTVGNRVIIDEINPFVLTYNINSIVLPEVKYLEFGLIVL